MNSSETIKTNWLISIILGALTFLWFHHIYQIYFESSISDIISLIACLFIGWVVGYKFRNHLSGIWITMSIACLAATLILLQPIVFYLLGSFSLLWALVHLLLALCGLAISLIHKPLLSAIPIIAAAIVWVLPFNIIATQKKYYDRVIAELNTPKGFAQVVEWKDNQWVYYNNSLLTSTIDNHVSAEALIHPVMQLANSPKSVLIIGGEEMKTLQELAKYSSIHSIDVLPYDVELFQFMQKAYHPKTPAITLLDKPDIPTFLQSVNQTYDLIIIDLPLNLALEFKPFATQGFVENCAQHLSADGFLVTKSFNPYLSLDKFEDHIQKIDATGLNTIPYHTQIPTIGQSSWIVASKTATQEEMISNLKTINLTVETQWFNQDAMNMMRSFGEKSYFEKHTYLVNELTPH